MTGDILPDILEPGLRVVFCGTQAGAVSARRGAYYAGPGNKFWPVLHEIGLVPMRLQPEEFATLPRYGIGLTDVAKRSSGPDSALRGGHFDVAGFTARIAANRPRILAFNGKRAAQVALGIREGGLAYGPQTHRLADAETYILPSTSGAAAGFWSIEPWKQLAMAVTGTQSR
ncbi:mismatch-specific DNA-glycosylase [Bosea robiniae]|jgi:TDG/mug DNA glycosylase family protein|uniref:TDG/mug DNA glycosylase family protein n=1 Tax=Bosea robiniae TaxID=1036780 RepID=A0ABY0NKH5_9HYPH|nr:mismatch-specific DNA-glycosylase [Bosea robiniae]SDF58670.1 TDG/mug DNA glycosylase family protein [Bosea robiniae]